MGHFHFVSQQFFALLAPHLLLSGDADGVSSNDWDTTCNLLDPAVFKNKSKQSKTEHKQGSSKD
jgi:hypothetical protein